MTFRREPIYITTDVWKVCSLLAQSKGRVTDDQGLSRTVTVDEVADTLLRELFAEKYPQIAVFRKQIKKLEADFIKELGGGK